MFDLQNNKPNAFIVYYFCERSQEEPSPPKANYFVRQFFPSHLPQRALPFAASYGDM
jgi:hypothetical protein